MLKVCTKIPKNIYIPKLKKLVWMLFQPAVQDIHP